jgi:hypothetical protein
LKKPKTEGGTDSSSKGDLETDRKKLISARDTPKIKKKRKPKTRIRLDTSGAKLVTGNSSPEEDVRKSKLKIKRKVKSKFTRKKSKKRNKSKSGTSGSDLDI